jgi:hypothetical protein
MVKARLYPALALAVVGAVMGIASNAHALTMADLTNSSGLSNGSSVTVGDLVFDNFSFSSAAIDASKVEVVSVADGLEFHGNFTSAISPTFDFLVGYTVTSPSPIKTVNLGFDGAASGTAIAAVSETILPDGKIPMNEGLSTISGYNSTDSLDLGAGLTSFSVKKDVGAFAAPGGVASITFVSNTYSTTGNPPPVIPEPATLALVPLGLAGLAIRRKLAR